MDILTKTIKTQEEKNKETDPEPEKDKDGFEECTGEEFGDVGLGIDKT